MNSASWMVFSNLIEKSGPEKKPTFIKYLSSTEQVKLSEIKPSEINPISECLSTKQRIAKVHYSWLITFLESFAENDKILILAAFEETQSRKLCSHFKIQEMLPLISSHSKNYLLNATYQWLISNEKEFIPLEFLPMHPLNKLLYLSKSEIQSLVDYLGIHDLAAEIRHVVKIDQIKKMQKALSKNQQEYLKSLLKEKEPVFFVRLNLDGWDGNEEKLKSILLHRGFNRLAKSIFGCHPSFLWHICHTLDTGRTKIIKKFFKNINNKQVQELLIKQVQEIIPMVQKEK